MIIRTIYNTLLFLVALTLTTIALMLLSVGICTEEIFITARVMLLGMAVFLFYLALSATDLLFNRR